MSLKINILLNPDHKQYWTIMAKTVQRALFQCRGHWIAIGLRLGLVEGCILSRGLSTRFSGWVPV
ncbi:MAG: hypothetical protein ACRDAP_14505, partial [Shewanella sp.]